MVDLIKSFCNDNDLSFRADYSGRNMFGQTCCGVVCDDFCSTLLQLAQYLFDSGIDDVVSALGLPSWDSMGMQSILYFPNMEV